MNNQDYIIPLSDVNVFRLGKFCASDYECCRYGNSDVKYLCLQVKQFLCEQRPFREIKMLCVLIIPHLSPPSVCLSSSGVFLVLIH